MKQKSWILSLLALVLIACAMVQPALAYFTANTNANGGLPIYFVRETKIEEEMDGLAKKVTITNTGGAHPEQAGPVWIRARAYVGQEYLQYLEVSGDSWSDGLDGWWYFATPVPVGQSASVLKVELKNMPVVDKTEISFKDVNVAVVYESASVFYNENGSLKAADWTAKLDTGTSTPSGS